MCTDTHHFIFSFSQPSSPYSLSPSSFCIPLLSPPSLTLQKICTHNGTFHCDEALACFMLHQTKEFKDAGIPFISSSSSILLPLSPSPTLRFLALPPSSPPSSVPYCALSLLMLQLEIVRTRDPSVINEQAIVVDVGGVYDPSK